MFKPVYWYHGNVKFPEAEVKQVISELRKIGREFIVRGEAVTSYHYSLHQRPDKIWNKNYAEICKEITKNAGIYSTCRYDYQYWSQLYTTNNTHPPHHPYNDSYERGRLDIRSDISFVHIIQPQEKAFKYIDNEGNYHTLLHQEPGDIICFPSWVWHWVAPVQSPERFCVAGNIELLELDFFSPKEKYENQRPRHATRE